MWQETFLSKFDCTKHIEASKYLATIIMILTLYSYLSKCYFNSFTKAYSFKPQLLLCHYICMDILQPGDYKTRCHNVEPI